MKNLNLHFTDAEYKELETMKTALELTWHDFFLDIKRLRDNKIISLENQIKDLKEEIEARRVYEERWSTFTWAFNEKTELFEQAYARAVKELLEEEKAEFQKALWNRVLVRCFNCSKYTPHKYEKYNKDEKTTFLVCEECGNKRKLPFPCTNASDIG